MNRTQAKSTARLASAAPTAAVPNIASGLPRRSAKRAVPHNPTYAAPPGESRGEEPADHDEEVGEPAGHQPPLPAADDGDEPERDHAEREPEPGGNGERLQRGDAQHRGHDDRHDPHRTGRLQQRRSAARRARRSADPIQATNVPSIHQTGRYHHVDPPPIASHVHGYALTGRRTAMSHTANTTVPHNPAAAAAAMPSKRRAPVQIPGRKLRRSASRGEDEKGLDRLRRGARPGGSGPR